MSGIDPLKDEALSDGCGQIQREFWGGMKFIQAWALLVTALVSVPAALADGGDSENIEFRRDPDQQMVEVYVRGEHFTTYHYGEQHPRTPFLWPVLAEGGVGITRNYPMGEDTPSSTDHPHHRSLFVAAVVNGHDFFHVRDGVRVETLGVTTGGDDNRGWLRARNQWLNGDGTVLLDEVQEWRFYDTPASARYFDLVTTFTATHDEICFRDSDKYAFLAVRVRPEIEGDRGGAITNAHGDQGPDEVFGEPSPWVDYSGYVEGHGQRGIALFDHPDNFRAPFVFVRDYGLAMFNPFGNGGDNPNYTVAKDESLTLRYRVFVHSGDADEADVDGQYQRYIRRD